VRPGQSCRVQPLADVLADPGMAAGTMAIPGQQRLGIDGQQPVLLVGVDPRPQPAPDVDLRGREYAGRVGQTGPNHERDWLQTCVTPPGNASNPFTTRA